MTVLGTKLHVPPVRPDLVPRPRLTDRMASWFEKQSRQVQTAILNGPEDQAARLYLEEKASGR